MQLTQMKNLGKAMEKRLAQVGIETAEQLRQMGSRQAFFLLKSRDPQVCLVHLYALEAAIEDVDIGALSPETRHQLKQYSHSL